MKPTAIFAQFTANGGSDKLYDVFDTTAVATLEDTLVFLSNLTSFAELDTRKEELSSVEYIFSTWGAPTFTREQIAGYLPNLKAYFYGAGSVQYFARPLLQEGVRVFCAASANAVPVAELCLAQILLANKGFYQSGALYSKGHHTASREYFDNLPGNYSEIVGLIGCGAIAKNLIEKLKPFQLDIIVYDPYLAEAQATALGVRKVTLDELFKTSLSISNHLPNNEETKGMLNYQLFSHMRPYATFINTGRGAQVIEDDLVRAMKEVPTRTAVLDVTFPEPVEAGHPFFALDNIILTPHIAGSAGNELRRMGRYMADECLALLQNKPLHHEVTLEMLVTMA